MKEAVLKQAVVVPSADIELAMKQEEGWSYFKGGKYRKSGLKIKNSKR